MTRLKRLSEPFAGENSPPLVSRAGGLAWLFIQGLADGLRKPLG
jgi:hypothetical protein